LENERWRDRERVKREEGIQKIEQESWKLRYIVESSIWYLEIWYLAQLNDKAIEKEQKASIFAEWLREAGVQHPLLVIEICRTLEGMSGIVK
jgi:hypothetical protein